MQGKGIVYLVGAGPGDPGLITVKALECIRKADVIVYDQLANPIFLNEAKAKAELIDVGKRAGNHTVPQSEINRLLVRKSKEGKIVTRLKGGDPLIFGRGAEEAEELLEDDIPFEIVPGISSSIAAPAYAGIPVTHRECASTFAVITGHEDPGKEKSTVRWNQLANAADTLVILMGVGNIKDIVQHLIKGGRSLSTPMALVQQGTSPTQRTVVGTLKNIVELAKKEKVSPPTVMVVGDVVNKRKILNWFESKPLFGKKILVTRTRAQASDFVRKLSDLGAAVVEYPTIEINDLDDYSMVDKAIENIRGYDWVIFTSTNGVDKFFHRLYLNKMDARVFSHIKIATIGPATAKKLKSFGLQADLVPTDEFRAESIIKDLRQYSLRGKKVLIVRAKVARDILPETLNELGAVVDVLPVYETKIPKGNKEFLKKNITKSTIPDMITFTSSSTVENFIKSIPKPLLKDIKKNAKIASIGPITSQTAKKLGLKVHLEAKEYTIPGLTDAIQNYYKKR